jgi:DNA replication and repair protein RecF
LQGAKTYKIDLIDSVRLEKLKIANFKNYTETSLSFSSRINVLVGKNGSGKTNFLDAIHYLSFTKSAFNSSDYQNIKHGQSHFFIKGEIKIGEAEHEIICGVQTGLKKNFKNDGSEYQKLSDHIGKYPMVLFAPDDVDLVKEGSEARRKFFDGMISQMDKAYLENLIQYNQAVKQRNGLLKIFNDSGKVDWLAIEAYDRILISAGEYIYNRRKQFVEEFLPVFNHFYNFLVSREEVANLDYQSALGEIPFADGLLRARQKDLVLQRTGFGIHRDDFEFTLENGDLKRLGSQGQQKSFVIALKLAQTDILKKHKGFSPILLLDDIFDKLDDHRIGELLELIKNDDAQLFVTDARPDRTRGLMQQINVPASVFVVKNGGIISHG